MERKEGAGTQVSSAHRRKGFVLAPSCVNGGGKTEESCASTPALCAAALKDRRKECKRSQVGRLCMDHGERPGFCKEGEDWGEKSQILMGKCGKALVTPWLFFCSLFCARVATLNLYI